MTGNAKCEIYMEAIEQFGVRNQLDIAIEEMSELIKELCKAKRNFKNRDAIVEEVSDVLICLEQIGLIFDISEQEVDNYTDYKLTRLAERIKEAKNNGKFSADGN